MDIDSLIAKYLSKECSPEEIDEINRWKKTSSENDLIFRRSEEAWHLARSNRKHAYMDKGKTWNKIHKRIARKYSLPLMMRVAGIAASVAFLLGLTLPYIFSGGVKSKPSEPQIITLYVPKGVCSKTILPDSTVVWLNASSSISYPDFFHGNTRTIELAGEAFFDVKRDETKPFIIKSGDLSIKVLGTSFNFKHYAGDTHAVLAVETGKVTLSTAGASKVTDLDAGKYATINNRTLQTKVYNITPTSAKKNGSTADITPKMTEKETNTTQFSSWRSYKMVFRDEAFCNILNELSRRYNVEFEIRDEEINEYVYTATFDDMSLEDILELLKLSAPIDYKIKSLTSNTTNAYGKRKIIMYRK